MKTPKTLISTFAAALLLAGCVNEDPYYGKDPGGETPDGTGFLSVGDMELRVVYDAQTETGWDDARDDAAAKAPRTRSNPTVDQIAVEIVDEAGATVAKKSYGEWKAQTDPIEMAAGNYTLKAYSAETIAAADWECPVYATEKDFTIRKGETTRMPDLVCTLANIKVTVGYAADLADLLSEDTAAEVTLGANTLRFAKGDARAAYFRAEEETNTLRLDIAGTFADTGKSVSLTKTISGVRAGQWRKITFIIENADKGNLEIGIVVDSFIQDEEIVVDGTGDLWEPVIDETEAPTIEWPGHDLAAPLRLDASMFDGEGHCTTPVVFDLKASRGIAALGIAIGSDNADLLARLSGMGIDGTVDLCATTPESALGQLLGGMGLPLGDAVAGRKTLALTLTGLMPQLYAFEGTHTLTLSMTDAAAAAPVQAVLTVLVDKQTAGKDPEIVWVNDRGYDFDSPATLTEDMTIRIDIATTSPITAFEVTIESEILRDLLPIIGLPEQFDLCTVTGETATTLGELGFPTGDKVNEQNPLTFDISQFVEVMMALDAGEHKFILSVTDSAGGHTTKTLHLVNE